jgi:hypothetical protein
MVRLRKTFIAAAVVTIAGLISAPGAFGSAADNPNASCLGSGSSALAPGQNLPFSAPGARANVSHFVVTVGHLLGVPPGQFIGGPGGFAHQKGTAAQCFPFGPPGGGNGP